MSSSTARRPITGQWKSVEEPDTETVQLLLMSELDRLEELARLTGQLRYAVDGQDTRLVEETATAVERIVGLLPESYNLRDYTALVQALGGAQPATGGAAVGSVVQAVQRRV